MTTKNTRRGETQKTENVVICPPCGESVAVATKEGQNRKKGLWPLLPRLTAVLPPQGREMTTCGFTLIELLVVVLIIGILAAVAVPQYQVVVEKSRAATRLPILKSILVAQQSYFMANGEYAVDFETLDISMPAGGTFNKEKNKIIYPQGYFYDLWRSSVTDATSVRFVSDGATYILEFFNTGTRKCYAKKGSIKGKKVCQALGGQQETDGASTSHDGYDLL